MEQMNSGPIKYAKMVTFRASPQIQNEQIISQAHQNPRTNIPQPIKTHPKLQNPSPNHNHKQISEDYVCTKYNKCFHQNRQNYQNRGNQKVFDIPRELLEFEEEEYQQNVDMRPEVGFKNYDNTFCDIRNNKIEEVDQFIRQQLRNYSKRSRESKSKEKSLQKQRIQKISALNKKAKQILQKDIIKRKKLQGENPPKFIRPKWGHAIFNDKIQEHEQEPIKEMANKATKRTIELKPTSDRIKDYEQKMVIKQQQQKRSQECKHKHSNRTKDQAQIQNEIREDAKNLLKQRKQQQKQQQKKKLITDAKIRAIQLQSIDSLKKFKKKPVDPTIQFVVDVPPAYSENKKKNKNKEHRKMSTKQVIETEKIKKENINSNVQKMKEYSERLRDTQREKNLLKSKQSSSKGSNSERPIQQQIQNQQNNYITNEQLQKNSRFYIWNIPVYHEDLPKLQQHFYETSNKFDKPKQKSFREQVKEYLQEKFHKQQQQQIKKKKEEYFYELVSKKKQNYLDQYQQSNLQNGSHNNQVYWDEDEIFKHAPLSNFNQF